MSNLPISAKISRSGHLEVGGCDTVALVSEFGSPLYVMDEMTVRERCREYKTAFRSRYPSTEIIFACKALCTTAMLKIIADEGLGADVVSGGELYTAVRAGVNPRKIYFHGNNKSAREIEEGLLAGVGRFVIDNLDELKNIDLLSQKTGARADVAIRVNPGIEAHTHEFIRTGHTDSKFGLPKDKVIEAVKLIKNMKNVNFVGLHAHIGSQILEVAPYVAEIEVLVSLAKEISSVTQTAVEELNIGGGLGIDYLDNTSAPSINSLAEAVASQLKRRFKEEILPEPKLVLEPGRSIVATAGVTLYTVGAIKDVPGVRKYVVVDGGMADNPRPILYQARYDALVASKASNNRTEKVTLAGRFCESGDVLIKDIMLQETQVGDIVAVLCTGAYNYSMSSNYNRVPRPAMVLVSGGEASIVVGRETYDDVVSKDILV